MTNLQRDREKNGPWVLGLEAGGTRTVAILADGSGVCRQRLEAGPANLRLLDDPALTRHFKLIAKGLPRPAALAIGLAGARTAADRARIRQAAAQAWPGVPCHATNDLETALLAGDSGDPATRAQVLVLSGTGS